MRHFTLGILAVSALYLSFGCGNNNNVKLDGGGTDGGMDDFSLPPSPDMAKAPPGCYALLGNMSLQSKATAATKAKYNAFVGCALMTCGSTQIVDGGNANLPCAMLVDGGVSDACNTCFNNIQVNMQISFTDPMTNMPIACQPNAQAPDCGACGNQIVACVLDCNSDADCMGLTHSDGTPSTCDLTMNACN
jgi:hypothetical protein